MKIVNEKNTNVKIHVILFILSSAVLVLPNNWFWFPKPCDLGLWRIMKTISAIEHMIQRLCSIVFKYIINLKELLLKVPSVWVNFLVVKIYSPCSFNNAKPKANPTKVITKLTEPAATISFPIFYSIKISYFLS